MNLGKKISSTQFIFSQILILVIGLGFLTGLYYTLNSPSQQPKNSFKNGPVTTAPKSLKLDLDQPSEDVLLFSPSVVVSGKTAPVKDVLISQEGYDVVIQSNTDGSFSTVLTLSEGANKITAVVFDATGDFRAAERTVYYSKEKI